MLANLLPGIRELRTPLVVGYLWLTTLWLWFHDRLPDEAAADGAVADLYDLGDLLPVGTILATVTFVAYFTGSVMELNVARAAWLEIRPSRPAWEAVADRFRIRLEDSVNATPEASRAASEAWKRTAPSKPAARIEVRPYVTNDQVKDKLTAEGHEVDLAASRIDERSNDSDRAFRVPDGGEVVSASYTYQYSGKRRGGVRWASGPGGRGTAVSWTGRGPNVGDDTIHRLPPMAIAALYAVDAELPDLATRLLIERPAVFDRYDRLMAEASIRVNMFPPLLILVVTMAIRAHWLWSLGLVVCSVLFFQGLLRRSHANAVVLDSIATRLIESPTMVALEGAYSAPRTQDPGELSDADDAGENETSAGHSPRSAR